MYEGELVGGKKNIRDLNDKAVEKLYELLDSLDSKSEPDLIRACIESLAKLNQSIKGNDALVGETDEERRTKEKTGVVEALLRKEK